MNKSNHTELHQEGANVMQGKYCLACCNGSYEEARERAALIVHRVNNWDKLVEALEMVDKDLSKAYPSHYHETTTCETIKAALKLAKEGI